MTMPDPTSTTEVEACPFCGENNAVVNRTRYLDGEAFSVSCRTRGCHGAVFSLGYGQFATAAEAIAAWNNRTAITPRAQVEAPVEVHMIETVTGDFHTEAGEPFWRVEIDGYCADFDHEQAAVNFAAAINARIAQVEAEIDLPTAFEAWWQNSPHKNSNPVGYGERKCLAFAAFEACATAIERGEYRQGDR